MIIILFFRERSALANIQTPKGNVCIASFNLRADFPISLFRSHRWQLRRQLATQMIRNMDADIIGVQELLPNMRRDIQDILRQEYSVLGFGRFGKLGARSDEHSDILVKKQNIKIEHVKTFWLSKYPERLSRAYYAVFPRICTVAELYVEQLESSVRIFNTHLDHICGLSRTLGINVILKYMNEYHKKNPMPIVLMGDLNCRPNSLPVRLLREHADLYPDIPLTDVYSQFENSQISNTFHNFSGKIKSGAYPIDYMFVSKEFDILGSRIVTEHIDGKYPSDHYPLLARLRLKEQYM